MESKKRKNSYTCVKKLEIVKYSKIHGNREAGKVYNVNEASIREWKKNKKSWKRWNRIQEPEEGERPVKSLGIKFEAQW